MKSSFTKTFTCLTLLFLFFTSSVLAQVQTARYTSMDNSTKGYYEYLPEGYGDDAQTYPLLLCIHGVGNCGNGGSELYKVLGTSPSGLINKGIFPTSFTVNNQTFKFIVITPQFLYWPNSDDIQSVLNYVTKHYKVDLNRIYLTGYSMGGGVTWDYASSSSASAKALAAIVPICGASLLDVKHARTITSANLPVWATHNDEDPTVPVKNTLSNISYINLAPAPTPVAKKTIFNSTSHNAWTQTYDPNYRENGMNIYEWMLQYQRGTTTTTNQAPKANAGANQSVTLPDNSVDLTGSGADADDTITNYQWTKVSGPSQFTISNADAANTTVSNLIAGTYVFRLTVTSSSAQTASDDVTVVVNPAPVVNQAPKAYAGSNQSITLPVDDITLTGSGTDTDGQVVSFAWNRVGGPDAGTIADAAASKTLVSNLIPGNYYFELTVKDNDGATGKDTVQITVNDAPNQAPQVNAGDEQTITLPTDSVTLIGSASDGDGNITSYTWTKVGGPSNGTVVSATTAQTAVTGLVQGTYLFELKVTDNDGAVDKDTVTVNVKADVSSLTTTNSSSTATKYIKVAVYGGADAYTGTGWNNWNVGTAEATNITNTNLNYTDGTDAAITATLSHTGGIGDNRATYKGGMAPAGVLRHMSYSNQSRTLTISGLSTDKTYNLELYASRYSTGNYTVFAVNGSKSTISVYDNHYKKAVFNNLIPNDKGEIVVTVGKLYSYSHLNGFMLTEQGSDYVATSANQVQNDVMSEQSSEVITDTKTSAFNVFPNPIESAFVLQVNNSYSGTVKAQVVNMNGAVQKEYTLSKSFGNSQYHLSASGLAAGTYILRVQMGTIMETKKIIKQ